MKILCVIDSLGSGGAQRQLVNLAIGFKEHGHQVSFLVYHNENFFKKLLDEQGILVLAIIESNYLKRLIKMRKYIRKNNFDSVLSFLEAANFICEIAGLPCRNWKLVVGERSANPNILKSFKLKFYRWVHLLADHVVANSNENIKLIRKVNPLLPSERCHVIYNIVDFVKWKHSTAYIPVKDGKFTLLVVASHNRLKNLDTLIEAVSLLTEEEKEKLIIEWYGDKRDDSKERAIEKINQKGLTSIFKFYPAILSIAKKMQLADAVGMFSYYEGLPNAIIEGMSCAKPVICSSVSDLPIFISDRNLLFDPNQSEKIADSLKYLLRISVDDLKNIGSGNRRLAELKFNGDNIIDEYISLLS